MSENSKNRTVNVKIAPVEKDTRGLPIDGVGRLRASAEMKLSFKTGGFIKYVINDNETRVKEGTMLALLDTTETGALAGKALSVERKAARDFERISTLYQDSVATKEQFENAKTAAEMAKQDLALARYNLEHSVIRAPSDGRILKKLIQSHELVGSGTPAFFFASVKKTWEISVPVTDRDVSRILAGDSAVIRFDAGRGINVKGVVNSIAESADLYTGTFMVDLLVSSANDYLKSGFIGAVTIFPQKSSGTFWIPIEALIDGSGSNGKVLTVGNDGNIHSVVINIAKMYDDKIAVFSGLENVTNVITRGGTYASEGFKAVVLK